MEILRCLLLRLAKSFRIKNARKNRIPYPSEKRYYERFGGRILEQGQCLTAKYGTLRAVTLAGGPLRQASISVDIIALFRVKKTHARPNIWRENIRGGVSEEEGDFSDNNRLSATRLVPAPRKLRHIKNGMEITPLEQITKDYRSSGRASGLRK